MSGLVPELLVSKLEASLHFWVGMLEFKIKYDRPEEHFAYLHHGEAEVMLEEFGHSGRYWKTGPLEHPFGRGSNFQIEAVDWSSQLKRLRKENWPLFMEPEEKWYRSGEHEVGQRQFLVQDPDGYLLRLAQSIGKRKPQ